MQIVHEGTVIYINMNTVSNINRICENLNLSLIEKVDYMNNSVLIDLNRYVYVFKYKRGIIYGAREEKHII